VIRAYSSEPTLPSAYPSAYPPAYQTAYPLAYAAAVSQLLSETAGRTRVPAAFGRRPIHDSNQVELAKLSGPSAFW